MMDETSRQVLDEILAQEPAALTDADKDFLRARRSYLTEEQRHVYADVLAEDQTFEPDTEGRRKKAKKLKLRSVAAKPKQNN